MTLIDGDGSSPIFFVLHYPPNDFGRTFFCNTLSHFAESSAKCVLALELI